MNSEKEYLGEREEQVEANMPRRSNVGLRRTVLATSNDKHDERVAKLQESFKNHEFELVDHDTRKQIVVTGPDDLTPGLLEDMRRVARSIV